MRLIDADFALSRAKPYSSDDENWTVTGGTVIRLIHNAIDDAPTIDAVPVVRCRDCKWFNTDRTNDMLYNTKLGFHDKSCEKWGGNAFCYLNDLFIINSWQEDPTIYMTKSEAEEKYGIKIIWN